MVRRLLSTLFAVAAVSLGLACGDGTSTTVGGCESSADCPANYVCEAGSCNLVGAPIGDGDDIGGDEDVGDTGDAGDAGDARGDGDGEPMDELPPAIQVASPLPYEIVGTILHIQATITDDLSGVEVVGHHPGVGAALAPGTTWPISFAVWLGSDENRGGRKHIANWQTLVLEAEA